MQLAHAVVRCRHEVSVQKTAEYLTVPELQELLKISRASAYKLAAQIGVRPFPNMVRISRAALEAKLADSRTPARVTDQL